MYARTCGDMYVYMYVYAYVGVYPYLSMSICEHMDIGLYKHACAYISIVNDSYTCPFMYMYEGMCGFGYYRVPVLIYTYISF